MKYSDVFFTLSIKPEKKSKFLFCFFKTINWINKIEQSDTISWFKRYEIESNICEISLFWKGTNVIISQHK